MNGLFNPIELSHLRYGPNIIRNMPDHSLDIAWTDTFELISLWSRSLPVDMTLVHDRSSAMAKNKAIWLPDSNRAKKSAKASSLLDTSINPLKT